MITEKTYLEAQKIVDDYKEQLRIAAITSSNSLKEAKLKREQECGEHYYISSGGKWSGQGQMTCQNCGKKID